MTTQTQNLIVLFVNRDAKLLTLFTNVVFLLPAAVWVDRVGNFSSLCTD